tara:strand:+ start:31181 stop:34144 length:2964 start_codon:yes stop_codon:yes gene_type:complete
MSYREKDFENLYLNNRKYFIPVPSPIQEAHIVLGESLGWYQPPEQFDLKRKIQKSTSGKYTHFLLPPNSLYFDERDAIVDELSLASIPIVQQILTSQIQEPGFLVPQAEQYELIMDQWNDRIHGLFQELFVGKDVEPSLLLTKTTSLKEVKSFCIAFDLEVLPTRCPAPQHSDHPFLTPRQAEKVIRKLYNYSKIRLVGPSGIELYEPRSAADATLEALYKPEIQFTSPHSEENKSISVIIPTYNNGPYLKRTLEHLFAQDLDSDRYEVIVVDDGSSDSTLELIEDTFSTYKGNVNFKYIYFPRNRERKMGDSQFRAGISRNLGNKYATGEYVLFLDSDILTPTWFLTDLLKKHEKWDVIQGRRYDLTKDASRVKQVNYESVDLEKDTFVTDKGYWVDFYDKCKDWNELSASWKYVCTHSLSMKREVYEQVGWIKKTFIYYGFEDTDLGFRLVRSGYKLHLNDTKLYHLFHQDERSEFDNSDIKRHEILSKTAQIFYRNNFDPEIFSELGIFMRNRFDPNIFSFLFSFTWIYFLFKYLVAIPLSLAFKIVGNVIGALTLPFSNSMTRRLLNRHIFSTTISNENGFIQIKAPTIEDLTLKPESTLAPEKHSLRKYDFSTKTMSTLWLSIHAFVRLYFSVTRNPGHPITWFWGKVILGSAHQLKLLFVVSFYYKLIHTFLHKIWLGISFVYFHTIHTLLHKIWLGVSFIYFHTIHALLHKVWLGVSFIYFHTLHIVLHQLWLGISFVYFHTLHKLIHRAIIPMVSTIYFATLYKPLCELRGLGLRAWGQIKKISIAIYHPIKLAFVFLYFQIVYKTLSQIYGASLRVSGFLKKVLIEVYHPVKLISVHAFYILAYNPTTKILGALHWLMGFLKKIAVKTYHPLKLLTVKAFYVGFYNPVTRCIGYGYYLRGQWRRFTVYFYHRIYRRVMAVLELCAIKFYWLILYAPVTKAFYVSRDIFRYLQRNKLQLAPSKVTTSSTTNSSSRSSDD